jgi:hypothetical protein
MKGVYRLFLLLYPAEYRRIFGEEMTKVFDDLARERGPSPRFALAEIAGLIGGAARAWTSNPMSYRAPRHRAAGGRAKLWRPSNGSMSTWRP